MAQRPTALSFAQPGAGGPEGRRHRREPGARSDSHNDRAVRQGSDVVVVAMVPGVSMLLGEDRLLGYRRRRVGTVVPAAAATDSIDTPECSTPGPEGEWR